MLTLLDLQYVRFRINILHLCVYVFVRKCDNVCSMVMNSLFINEEWTMTCEMLLLYLTGRRRGGGGNEINREYEMN